MWCTTTEAEQYKCRNFTVALERDRALFEEYFINVTCYQAFSTDECVQMIDSERCHMMSLDAGNVFMAGRYHSLIPLMQESFDGGFVNYYSVAVVKKDTIPDVVSIRDLRGKKACFSEVGSQAGWTIPIHTVNENSTTYKMQSVRNQRTLFKTISFYLKNILASTRRRHGNHRL